MARIDSIFKSETKKAEQHPKRITKWIHYTNLRDHEAQYCNEKDGEEIEALADLIEADGEVLQDLLVKKTDTDEYKIIAGHKRRRACKLLVEERGLEKFALVPCVVENISDVRAEFQLYSSNGHHEKTEYEKMHELERMKYLLEKYPEEFPQVSTGRMVERLAKLLNMKKTTVGEYLTISKNLGEKGMEKFRSGELKKSAAVELSSLPEKRQDELIERGITKHGDIKKARREEQQETTGEELLKPDKKEEQTESAVTLQLAEQRSKTVVDKHGAGKEDITDTADSAGDDVEHSDKSDLQLLKEMLEKEEHYLREARQCYSEEDVYIRRQKLKVSALTDYMKKVQEENTSSEI